MTRYVAGQNRLPRERIAKHLSERAPIRPTAMYINHRRVPGESKYPSSESYHELREISHLAVTLTLN